MKILSRHTSLASAVAASSMDLSYNEEHAKSCIARLDKGDFLRKIQPVTEAFVTDEGVWFIFQCDLKLLNKFEPFFSSLNDSPFSAVEVSEEEITVFPLVSFPKTKENRKKLAKMGILVTSL